MRGNPGPKPKPNDNLSVSHWNENSIPSDNFQKIVVLESFVATHKFDIICLSETFLNNTYEDNDLNQMVIVFSEWINQAMQKGEEFVLTAGKL